jgi:hypothetical protein
MADQLNPSKPRLTPAELTTLSRQNAQMARLAREAGCLRIADSAARAAVYYRERRAQPSRATRAARGRAA